MSSTLMSIVQTIKCAHLGLAVCNLETSIQFLYKIGFTQTDVTRSLNSRNEAMSILQNRFGFEIHLFVADNGLPEPDKNILMDFPLQKYPGHTHVCFGVSTVNAAKKYFESHQLSLTGERKPPGYPNPVAIFIRDPDRNTLEFEKVSIDSSIGGRSIPKIDDVDIEEDTITTEDIGYPYGVDHTGIRVNDPPSRALWYQQKLGFTNFIHKYELNPEPLKNNGAWVLRNKYGVDVNLIPNANIPVTRNILTQNGKTTPGIMYLTFTVDDATSAAVALEAVGVTCIRDEDIGSENAIAKGFELPLSAVVTYPGHSVFVLDDDYNIIRLISSSVANPLLTPPPLTTFSEIAK